MASDCPAPCKLENADGSELQAGRGLGVSRRRQRLQHRRLPRSLWAEAVQGDVVGGTACERQVSQDLSQGGRELEAVAAAAGGQHNLRPRGKGSARCRGFRRSLDHLDASCSNQRGELLLLL
jgi:hypothetical protein